MDTGQRWKSVGQIYAARRGRIAELARLKEFSIVGLQDAFQIDEDLAESVINGYTEEYETWLREGKIGERPVLYDQL